MEIKDLYTSTEIRDIKEKLYKEQSEKCAMTGLTFPLKDFHTDHLHDDEQLIRAVLYKQSNMVLGKLEGLWTRYLSYWYSGTLSDFLRQAADYLEKYKGIPVRHNGWLKKVKTEFNKLNAKQQQSVLLKLGGNKLAKNAEERKKLFNKLTLDRSLGFNVIMKAIKETKEQTAGLCSA